MPEYRSLPRRRRLTTGLAVVALLVVVLAVWGLQRVSLPTHGHWRIPAQRHDAVEKIRAHRCRPFRQA